MAEIIQSLWIGRPLSAIERLSIASFLSCGYEYHLYCYEDVGGVPAGAVLKDGNGILPASEIFCYQSGAGRGSVAAFSNLFRYKLLWDKGGWWADTDVVCLQPWDFHGPLILASEHTRGPRARLTNGVMKLPRGHPVAAQCYEAAMRADRGSVRWGELGSALLTRAVVESNLLHLIMKPEVFCPLPWWNWDLLRADNSREAESFVTDQSHSVHLWHEMWRRAGVDSMPICPPTSYFSRLLGRFGVDP